MSFTLFADARLALARDSLAGLSTGDALGAQYFLPTPAPVDLATDALPSAPWEWTDDTEMACSVLAQLADSGGIDRDRLALSFAQRCTERRATARARC